ncbi:putative reverse transcriptase domain-containing protein [Tanacetum coccineum]
MSFDELMDTSFDSTAFVLNQLNIKDLTQEIIVGATFKLLKGTCKSITELEYHLKECSKATTKRLDWHNPEGKPYPFDLSKPLSLIEDHRGHQVIPQDFLINNDLEYLKGGDLSRRYSTSVMKTKAATYQIKWIEDLVRNLFAANMSSSKDVYSKKRIIAITKIMIMKKYDYGYLDEIEKLTNLTIDKQYALNVVLCIFTRWIVIQRWVEDLQLGVESYQKTLNLTKPDTFRSNIRNMTTYTAYSDPKGVIYEDQKNRNRLMHADELHKFSDGSLSDVQTTLNDIAKGIRMEYLPKRKWTGLDKRRARVMFRFSFPLSSQNQRDLPKDIPLDSVEVLRLPDGGSSFPIRSFHLIGPTEFAAPPSPDYVPSLEHPPLPDYVLGPKEPEHAPLFLDYVPEPEYLKYLVPSDAEVHVEDQPLPADASSAALSLSYVANSNSEEDLEEDPEEDPVDYPTDGGDYDDDKSSNDDEDDDDEDEEQEAFEDDDDEEEEHLALADSSAVPVPSAEDTEAFETDESAPTPVSSPRSASPPTHHPSKIPSPPLLLPSTTYRDDIPKVDMPLQNRSHFFAPASRFEVKESSAAAVTRHVDDMVGDMEERALTTVEGLSQRVTDLSTTLARDTHEIYVRLEDAQDERALQRAQKMPPKRTAVTTIHAPITDAQIKALITQGVADALAEIEANRNSINGNDNHDSRTGSRRTERAAREMLWKTLKKMMTAKYCPRGEIKKLEIKLWNLKVKESDEVKKYGGGLPDMIQGSVMASKPKTMQDAIEFATELIDQKIHSLTDHQAENKKKFDDTSRNNQNQQQPFKRHNVARAYTAGTGEKKDCRSQPAAVNSQRNSRTNQMGVTCYECGVQGHYKKDFPKLKNKNQGNQAENGNAAARAYAMVTAGTNPNSNVVMGTFILNNRYASILLDTGADRSFVSTAFSSLIDIVPTSLDYGYDIELDDDKII